MMSMADDVAIGVETLRTDSGCSLQKEFTELIRINPSMILLCLFFLWVPLLLPRPRPRSEMI